jgi:FKBP-type peptidyl-prolyl cis-trans isomerase
MKKKGRTAAALGFVLCLISCSSRPIQELRTNDIVMGEGALAVPGTTVTVHYTGWLYENGRRGKKFDSSLDAGQPFTFRLGSGEVIQGWDVGINGMRVGGKRELIIPPEMGYGRAGAPPVIPPDSVLAFEVQLIEVQH